MHRLVEVVDLPIVQQDDKPVALESGDGFVKLLFPVQHRALPNSIEDSLRFLRLNQTTEYLRSSFVEAFHFFLHENADQLAKRQCRGIKLKCAGTAALTGGGFIDDRKG